MITACTAFLNVQTDPSRSGSYQAVSVARRLAPSPYGVRGAESAYYACNKRRCSNACMSRRPSALPGQTSGATQRCLILESARALGIRDAQERPRLRTGRHVLSLIESACLAIVTSETPWSVPLDVGRHPREQTSRIVDTLDADRHPAGVRNLTTPAPHHKRPSA